METLPSISILIPAKNAAETLHIAIEDASKQVDVDWKIIIANDNSTDNTLKVIQEYKAFIDQIEVINVPAPGGIVAGRNLLLQAVNTPYLAWLDADDGWCRIDKLHRQIQFLEKNPQHAIVGDGKVKGVFLENLNQKNFHFPLKNEDIQTRLVFKNAFIMSSIVARTAMVKDITFDPENEYLEDYVWVKTIANKYPVANIALAGTLHFISSQTQQQQKDEKYGVIEKEAVLLQNFLTEKGISIAFKDAQLLANFVRRNQKLDAATAKKLRSIIQGLSQELIKIGYNKERLSGFFWDIKLRIIKCRWFI